MGLIPIPFATLVPQILNSPSTSGALADCTRKMLRRARATAYNAVMQISKLAIACAGYRVSSGLGHHQSTL